MRWWLYVRAFGNDGDLDKITQANLAGLGIVSVVGAHNVCFGHAFVEADDEHTAYDRGNELKDEELGCPDGHLAVNDYVVDITSAFEVVFEPAGDGKITPHIKRKLTVINPSPLVEVNAGRQ